MPEKQRYEIPMIGSGEAGKSLAWRTALLWLAHQQPRCRVQKNRRRKRALEVEHVHDRAGDGIERLVSKASQIPIVLDEAQDRSKIRER